MPQAYQPAPFVPDAQLDFHGMGVLTAYDIEKLLHEFIEDCYIVNKRQLLVITGKGSVVRPLVERLLKNHKHVARFQHAGYFSGQTGAFEVVLVD